jgi:hypothetical protein
MSEQTIVGLNPALPWPLDRWAWWTEPVRAERLAALRIGVGLVLLLDIVGFYLPYADAFFGRDSLGSPGAFADSQRPLTAWPWSALSGLESALAWHGLLLLWALAAVLLTLGFWPKIMAGIAWFLAGSVLYVNPFLYNGGDTVRNVMLFYLMFCPSGAVWSINRRQAMSDPVYIYPWPLRLLFVQMALVYFVNGMSKLGPQWQEGTALHYVTSSVSWTRWSRGDLALPDWLLQVGTWSAVLWEITFPFTVIWRRTRYVTLGLGVLFHLGTGLALKLGPFPLYMLCLYLPLIPWERWTRPATPASVEA